MATKNTKNARTRPAKAKPKPVRRPTAALPLPATDRAQARFATRVLSIIRRIPAGRVTTYGTVAVLAGKPRAARAVGNIMAEAQEPGLPYHRVIAAGGALGGYSDLALKRQLLAAEGLVVTRTRVKQFAKILWP